MTDATKALWVDAGNGAAGDMLLAALLDAGADLAAVRAGLRGLAVEPVDVEVAPVRRHGLRAAHADVRAPRSDVTRGPAEVTAVLSSAALPEPAREFALAVFARLARAEARVHGVPAEQIHFHEVGALDAIADVTGCALALHDLGLLGNAVRIVSPVAAGSGVARAAHGPLPVPVPAVLELLTEAGAPMRGHPARMELCTPTGAALLATLATGWGPLPDITPVAVGTGAGTADPEGHPNILRVVIGETAEQAGWSAAELRRVDATVDDLDPRLWPDILESLRSAGAADAWCSPALMRKGRPGQVLSVLVAPERLDAICRAVFEQTTSLGVRVSSVERRALRRDRVEVRYGDATVGVKRGLLGGRVVTAQPEYDEAFAAARSAGRPVREVIDEVRARAGAHPVEGGLAAD
jgi:uncharacterized protein (TIGR00299 family) protein